MICHSPFLSSNINWRELSLVTSTPNSALFHSLYHILIFETEHHVFIQNVISSRCLFHPDTTSPHTDSLPLCHVKSLKPSSYDAVYKARPQVSLSDSPHLFLTLVETSLSRGSAWTTLSTAHALLMAMVSGSFWWKTRDIV